MAFCRLAFESPGEGTTFAPLFRFRMPFGKATAVMASAVRDGRWGERETRAGVNIGVPLGMLPSHQLTWKCKKGQKGPFQEESSHSTRGMYLCCPSGFCPFLSALFLWKGSDSFTLNQPKKEADSFFSHGHWVSEVSKQGCRP